MDNNQTVRTGHFLKMVKQKINNNSVIEKIKGESFNIFSILKMERNENRTHSAFLAELLNPNGTHFKGSKFLELFLSVIKQETFDISSAEISVEFHLGKKNDEEKLGGRADLLIKDKKDNVIIIENKVDAYDQNAQLQRYFNSHKDKKLNVYYLNKFGDDPSNESKGELISERDFRIISYRNHIIPWLELCLKEATEQPLLREPIKQYLLLIRKITHTMNTDSQNEFDQLMLEYFDEAKTVSEQFVRALERLTEKFRTDLIVTISKKLTEFEVKVGANINHPAAQIWIIYKEFPNSKIHFGIQPLSYRSEESLFYGIFVSDNQLQITYDGGEATGTIWYAFKDYLDAFKDYEVNFSKAELLIRLSQDATFRKELIEYISTNIIAYVEKHKEGLRKYIAEEHSNLIH